MLIQNIEKGDSSKIHAFYMHEGQSILAVVELKYIILTQLHTKYFKG